MHLDTTWLGALKVLILYDTHIGLINTVPLVNMVFLHLSNTMISEIDTSSLG